MKRLLLLIAIPLVLPAWAQGGPADGVERARIAAERKQVDGAYQAEEKACYGRFAVNDCLNDARSRRRAALADLRRQEVSLNETQRKARAALRLRSIEEREKERPQGGAPTSGNQPGRAATVSQEAAGQASAGVSRGSKAAGREEQARRRTAEAADDRVQRDRAAAENVKRQEKRLADARERKAKLDKRLAQRKRPDATPLPAAP